MHRDEMKKEKNRKKRKESKEYMYKEPAAWRVGRYIVRKTGRERDSERKRK